MCEQPTDIDYAGGLKKRQKVFEFDMATWRVRNPLRRIGPLTTQHIFQRAIKIFNITETKIPQRPPAKTKLGDKWYGWTTGAMT